MIVDVNTMKLIEKESGFNSLELMNIVGNKIKDFILDKYDINKKIIVLCGSGNNGGDGLVVTQLLSDLGFDIKACLVSGKIKSEIATSIYKKMDKKLFIDYKTLKKDLDRFDLVIDAIYGFGYYGYLSSNDTQLFSFINNSNKEVISIDINSGAEADGDFFDKNAKIGRAHV